MNKRKLSLIICSCVCFVLLSVVIAIGVCYNEPKHKHTLGESKTYHIYNNSIHYTRKCKDGCDVVFETNASLSDVFSNVVSGDKIVLEEDVTLTEECSVDAFVNSGINPQAEPRLLDLDIDFDLNNFTLSTDIDEIEHNSMFRFNVDYGTLNLNIYNGKLSSQDVSYIFRLKNTDTSGENIKLNINDVECEVSGIKASPLFIDECVNIEVNANSSKFISHTIGTDEGNFGVGAFINSDSEFNFTDCYFEGGDALYVRAGTVNLDGCKLVNDGLVEYPAQGVGTGFAAVGSCLTADSHTTTTGRTIFEITITNCEMVSNHCAKMICIVETADQESLEHGVDTNSVINVESCTFDDDPMLDTITKYNNIKYPNGIPQNNGAQIWACGEGTNN